MSSRANLPRWASFVLRLPPSLTSRTLITPQRPLRSISAATTPSATGCFMTNTLSSHWRCHVATICGVSPNPFRDTSRRPQSATQVLSPRHKPNPKALDQSEPLSTRHAQDSPSPLRSRSAARRSESQEPLSTSTQNARHASMLSDSGSAEALPYKMLSPVPRWQHCRQPQPLFAPPSGISRLRDRGQALAPPRPVKRAKDMAFCIARS